MDNAAKNKQNKMQNQTREGNTDRMRKQKQSKCNKEKTFIAV